MDLPKFAKPYLTSLPTTADDWERCAYEPKLKWNENAATIDDLGDLESTLRELQTAEPKLKQCVKELGASFNATGPPRPSPSQLQ